MVRLTANHALFFYRLKNCSQFEQSVNHVFSTVKEKRFRIKREKNEYFY